MVPKKAAPAPKKPAPAPVKAAEAEAEPVMSDAEIDAQAAEILNEIKAASSQIKEVENETLIQIDSDMTPEDELALGYLVQQFPSDYKDAIPAKKMPVGPTEKEKMAAEKKEMEDYAVQVAQKAADFQN